MGVLRPSTVTTFQSGSHDILKVAEDQTQTHDDELYQPRSASPVLGREAPSQHELVNLPSEPNESQTLADNKNNSNNNNNGNVPEANSSVEPPKPGLGPAPKPNPEQTAAAAAAVPHVSPPAPPLRPAIATESASSFSSTTSTATSTSTSTSTSGSTASTQTMPSPPSLPTVLGFPLPPPPPPMETPSPPVPTNGLGSVSIAPPIPQGLSSKGAGVAIGLSLAAAAVLASLAVLAFVLRRRGRFPFWRISDKAPKDVVSDRTDEDGAIPASEKEVVIGSTTTVANQSSRERTMGLGGVFERSSNWIKCVVKATHTKARGFLSGLRNRWKKTSPHTKSIEDGQRESTDLDAPQVDNTNIQIRNDQTAFNNDNQGNGQLSANREFNKREVSEDTDERPHNSTNPRAKRDSMDSITSCTTCKSPRTLSIISLGSTLRVPSLELLKIGDGARASGGSGWSSWFSQEDPVNEKINELNKSKDVTLRLA